MNSKEVDKMFNEAGITFDDMLEYIKIKYDLNNYNNVTKEEIQKAIDKIKKWKDEK